MVSLYTDINNGIILYIILLVDLLISLFYMLGFYFVKFSGFSVFYLCPYSVSWA